MERKIKDFNSFEVRWINKILKMKYLKNISDLILEKKIGQIASTVEITFGFDIDKNAHVEFRQDPSNREIEGHNNTFITNSEMSSFVATFRKEIATGIVNGDIESNVRFVIKSPKKELAMAIEPKQLDRSYWRLVIRTVFRESELNPFKTGRDQFVIYK